MSNNRALLAEILNTHLNKTQYQKDNEKIQDI